MKKRTVVLCLVIAIVTCSMFSGCGQIRNAQPITDVHNLSGQRVGVALAWGPDYLLSEREDITLMRYNNVAGAVTALCYNQIDAIAVEMPIAVDILTCISGLRPARALDYIGDELLLPILRSGSGERNTIHVRFVADEAGLDHTALISFPELDVDPLQHHAIDTLNLQLLSGFTKNLRSQRNGDGIWEVQINL